MIASAYMYRFLLQHHAEAEARGRSMRSSAVRSDAVLAAALNSAAGALS
jgi:hypothetical protein